MNRTVSAGVALAAMLVTAAPSEAQTIVGRVIDEVRGSPVAGAAVALVDRDGDEVAQAISDIAMENMDPNIIEAMAILTPIDARILYGERGDAGVVMVWTRRR